MHKLNEDTLAQQTTADYLRDALRWESVYAYNAETFGVDGTLGRKDETEIVLKRHLEKALIALNPGLPEKAYHEAVRQIAEYSVTQNMLQINREKYELLKEGVLVEFRNAKGELEKKRLRIIDFDTSENNDFLCVRELWVKGTLYRRRADIVGFVNGLPLVFMELKNVHRDIRAAYEENFADYKDTVPHLFHFNAVIILGNGIDAKYGSLSSKFEHFNDWKRLEEDAPGEVDMETLLKGMLRKDNFIDIFENYTLFDESSGRLIKIVARNHQFIGVNRAFDAVKHREERHGRLGVFWHTQGSGKSYSIVFFTRKIHRKLGGNFTFLVCTDRDDLDSQIYKTFAGCGLVDNDRDPCRADSGDHLQQLLNQQHKAYVFTLVQKFNKDVAPEKPYSSRNDIIVITDEAHRTQYGRLALNLRNSLPKASYIGFTGTPLFTGDEITRRVFGEYISTYDFQRAVEDNATVPLFYDARGEKLGIATDSMNEKIAEKLEELEIDDIDVAQRLEKELKRDYHIITAEKRLNQIAADFVEHYSTQWESGKAMLVCIDKVTCARMHSLILQYWNEKIKVTQKDVTKLTDEQELIYQQRKLQWMQETKMAVVVSEEQGEVDKFRKWNIDITPHRKLMKEGFETADGKRLDMESAFKKEDHPFRVAIVCAMWLTGFDVPSLATLYLDKPLKAHTLMQAIARANRINEGKNNGLVVDYCGILKNLRKALATFAGHTGAGEPIDIDPVRPEEDLLADLAESIQAVRSFVESDDLKLDYISEKQGFERNKHILQAKELINQNNETRKRFEIIAREVFKKFKACLTLPSVNEFRKAYDATNLLYKSLQQDTDHADVSDIIKQLHTIVDASIEVRQSGANPPSKLYDISRIDFEVLRQEFERSPARNTTVQSLKDIIERRLHRMMQQNPLRTNFQQHYEEIVSRYNAEKDRVNIEQTFEELIRFVNQLDEESQRAVREGLDEDSLAIYDLLLKPNLKPGEIERIKKVASDLLHRLQEEIQSIDNFKAKQSTRDEIKVLIRDFLWNEKTGLPESYNQQEIEIKTDAVFAYIYQKEFAQSSYSAMRG